MSKLEYIIFRGRAFVTGLFMVALSVGFLFAGYRCAIDPSVEYAFIKLVVALASACVLLLGSVKYLVVACSLKIWAQERVRSEEYGPEGLAWLRRNGGW